MGTRWDPTQPSSLTLVAKAWCETPVSVIHFDSHIGAQLTFFVVFFFFFFFFFFNLQRLMRSANPPRQLDTWDPAVLGEHRRAVFKSHTEGADRIRGRYF